MKISEIYVFFSRRLGRKFHVGQIAYVSYNVNDEWMIRITGIKGGDVYEEVLGFNGKLIVTPYESQDELRFGQIKLTSKYAKYI